MPDLLDTAVNRRIVAVEGEAWYEDEDLYGSIYLTLDDGTVLAFCGGHDGIEVVRPAKS